MPKASYRTKSRTLKICDVDVEPGEVSNMALPLPEIFSYSPMYMPIKIVHGRYQGPVLLIVATFTGNAINGIEIINRFLHLSLLKNLSGTIIAAPIFDVYGFITRFHRMEYTSNFSFDQAFLGSKEGSFTERYIDLFKREILSKIDYSISLSSNSQNYHDLPKIFADPYFEENISLAKSFAAPVISLSKAELGSFHSEMKAIGKPSLGYEAGELARFNEYAIRPGLRGIVNVLRSLGMLSRTKKESKSPVKPLFIEKISWIRTPKWGISRTKIPLGREVQEGERIATISDPFGLTEPTTVHAPYNGIIIGKTSFPICYEGGILFQIARFKNTAQAAEQIEDWRESQADNDEKSDA